jgi:hypothetical protein
VSITEVELRDSTNDVLLSNIKNEVLPKHGNATNEQIGQVILFLRTVGVKSSGSKNLRPDLRSIGNSQLQTPALTGLFARYIAE